MSKQINLEVIKQLQKKLESEAEDLNHQIAELKKDDPFSDPEHASDNAAVDTDVREQVGHETIEAEVKNLGRKLGDVELALKKISKKKYGVCERCGKPIPLARLKILPEARYCVECEEKLRK
jgi:DnaK suppressor protein